MKFVVIIFTFLFGAQIIYAQNNDVISLRKALQNETHDTARADIMTDLGWAYIFTKIDSAAYYGQEALVLSQKKGYVKGELASYELLTRVMKNIENYSEELRLAKLSLKKSEELKDTNRIFFARRGILWWYENIQDYNKALEYALSLVQLLDAPALKKRPNYGRYAEMAYRFLGSVYDELGKNDSTLKYYAISRGIAIEMGDPEHLALNAGTLAEYYLQHNNTDSAFYYYRISTPNAIISSRNDIITENLVGMASVYLNKGNTDSSLHYARQAMETYRSIPDTSNMKIVAKLLSGIFAKRNNIDSAYKYLKYADTLNELLAQQDKIKKARDMLFNQSLEDQQLKNERAQAEAQYENNKKIFLLVSVLLIMGVAAFMFYRNSRQKQRDAVKIQQAYDQLKSTQQQLIQSEKMASLGELTAGIAHEIQNPLNFVNNFSEVSNELLDEMKAELDKGDINEAKLIAGDIQQNLEKINHHGKRADAIVKGMLQHSRSSSGIKEPTDINALCDEYLRLAYHGLRAKDKSFNAKFDTEFDESIGKINVMPQEIGRVVLNLINNAFYAVNEKAKSLAPNAEGYEPAVTVTTKKENGKVMITVADNGTGIPQKVVDKIFQPFFTTKPTGEGTGLGLSLSYDIITKAHAGELKVDTKEGEGAIFKIVLPV